MKKLICTILVGIMLVAGVTAFAESEITAVGKGTVSVMPDVATLSVGVTETDMDIAKAMDTVNEKLDAIREAVKALGVKDDDITVSSLNLYSQYDYSETPETLVGFNVSHTLNIKTRALDTLGQLIDAAVAAGANQMNGVSFSLEDANAPYEKALALAVKNAFTRAAVMAEAAGMQLGDVEEIVESSDVYWDDSILTAKNAEMDAGSASTSVDYGMMNVTANVTAKFEGR